MRRPDGLYLFILLFLTRHQTFFVFRFEFVLFCFHSEHDTQKKISVFKHAEIHSYLVLLSLN